MAQQPYNSSKQTEGRWTKKERTSRVQGNNWKEDSVGPSRPQARGVSKAEGGLDVSGLSSWSGNGWAMAAMPHPWQCSVTRPKRRRNNMAAGTQRASGYSGPTRFIDLLPLSSFTVILKRVNYRRRWRYRRSWSGALLVSPHLAEMVVLTRLASHSTI